MKLWQLLALISVALLSGYFGYNYAVGTPEVLGEGVNKSYKILAIDCDNGTFIGVAKGEKVAKYYDYSKLKQLDTCKYKDLVGQDVKIGDRIKIKKGEVRFIRASEKLINPGGKGGT